ncbi:MAG: helix-turn-helix domain-containing protein [Clostridiales bacterium]|nr:helix-turn-helix domain-containing protein [Clostridiales bacterium]
MTQSERLKLLRKDYLNLTLEKFGDKLGVTRSAISNIETGSRSLTDQMIKSICREYHVSEDWLRDGEGEPFVETSQEDELISWAQDVFTDRDDAFRRRFVTMLMNLPPEGWKWLKWMVDKVYAEYLDEQKASAIDKEAALQAYAEELDLQEKAADGSSLSDTLRDGTA